MIETLVLVDGEHYPPTTRWALQTARAEGLDVVACLFVGGTEKVAPGELPDLGPVPVEAAGPDLVGSVRDAIRRHGPEAVLDLSDEPVLGYRERALVAAAALAEGVRYMGADFSLVPPIDGPALGSGGLEGPSGGRWVVLAVDEHKGPDHASSEVDYSVTSGALARGSGVSSSSSRTCSSPLEIE